MATRKQSHESIGRQLMAGLPPQAATGRRSNNALREAVTIHYPQHQRDTERSEIMNEQTRHNGSHAIEEQDVIATLWRQAVMGGAAARRALLWWMMHASAMET